MMQEILKPASQEYEKAMSDSGPENIRRRLPIGAEILSDGEIHFRVWAPCSQKVEVIIGADSKNVIGLEPEPHGYFSTKSPLAKAGDLYRYRLDGNPNLVPDPASRFQPEGPLGRP
jgi:maltooligosyltrehalose trehalohydrolase